MPYARDRMGRHRRRLGHEPIPAYRHLGLYAYKAALLDDFASLPPGKLEEIEQLEQLRVLENGREIAVGITCDPTIGVDTPEDAEKFESYLERAAGG